MEEKIKKIIDERRIEIRDKQDKYVVYYIAFFAVFFVIMAISTIILLPRYVRQYPLIISKYIFEIRTATIENNIAGMLLNIYLVLSALIPIIGIVLLLYKGIRFLVLRRIRK